VISSSQRPPPDNIQHSQQTDIRAPVGLEPIISTDERPQTYALDRAANWTGKVISNVYKYNISTLLWGLSHHYDN